MHVELAGHNVDSRVIDVAQKNHLLCVTPEVISAAYARISRSQDSVDKLRMDAVRHVEKARRSNERIVFGMGHSSIAEHAVFNIDVSGISRLAVEWLERFRLCSFTEKSQRYCRVDCDYIIPKEIAGTPVQDMFEKMIKEQDRAYNWIIKFLETRERDRYGVIRESASGRIKEDARYVTSLATTTQLGMTVNARNLELMIRRAANSNLSEVRELGVKLLAIGKAVAPSLMRHVDANPMDWHTYDEVNGESSGDTVEPSVSLVEHSISDEKILSRFAYEGVSGTAEQNLRRMFKKVCRYDAMPRAFEHLYATFEITLSASAYAQLKRHRMSTQTCRPYDISAGRQVPPLLDRKDITSPVAPWAKVMALSEQIYGLICNECHCGVAEYALTNAHRRQVLMTMNLREIYHFVRLRSDHHAQWEIRTVSDRVRDMIKEIAPTCGMLLCGKDAFDEEYQKIFVKSE